MDIKYLTALRHILGFQNGKTFCQLQELASVDLFIPNKYLLCSVLLKVSNIPFPLQITH